MSRCLSGLRIASLFASLAVAASVAAQQPAAEPSVRPASEPTAERASVVVVVGATGTEEYGQQFRVWADRWRAAAARGSAEITLIGLEAESSKQPDVQQLQEALTGWTRGASREPAWLVLIGHGTFDGKTARFNLRGPDLTATELAGWLKPVERPLVVINCASCSGPFLAELSAPGRVVITATKSGFEHNVTRLGEHLSRAIADPAADLDKDEETSILEALLAATAGVRESYARDARLETEHALIDDNGDRLGTPLDFFQGLKAVKTPKSGAAADGALAAKLALVRSPFEQKLSIDARTRRDLWERKLSDLKRRKKELSEDEYFLELEKILLQIGRLYESER